MQVKSPGLASSALLLATCLHHQPAFPHSINITQLTQPPPAPPCLTLLRRCLQVVGGVGQLLCQIAAACITGIWFNDVGVDGQQGQAVMGPPALVWLCKALRLRAPTAVPTVQQGWGSLVLLHRLPVRLTFLMHLSLPIRAPLDILRHHPQMIMPGRSLLCCACLRCSSRCPSAHYRG